MVPLRLGWAIRSPELAAVVECCARKLPVRTLLRQTGLDEAFAHQVRAMRPDVVLMEAADGASLAEWVVRFKALPDAPCVIAIERSADAESILAAFRAGADDFLHPPLEDKLRLALERESQRRRRLREASCGKGRVLGVLSVKGGCGGTTVACGLAVALARRLAPAVVLLDADFRSGLAGFLTGVSSPHSILDAMANVHRMDLDYWQALVSIGPAGLHVVPACPSAGFERGSDSDTLREVLRFARANYVWTIADLGSGLSTASRAVRDEVDLLYLVTTTDVLALYQCLRTVHGLEAGGTGLAGVRLVVNQAGTPQAMTREEVEKAVGLPVEAMLPEDLAAMRRWQVGERLPESGGALGRRLADFAGALMGVAVEQAPARSLWRSAFQLLHPVRRTA